MTDELSEAQRESFKARLSEMMAQVEQQITTANADSKPVDLNLSIGRLSRVDALQQQHVAFERRRRAEVQLQQLRAALSRVAAGTYGRCLECEEPIEVARLSAKPEAVTCKGCQATLGAADRHR